MAMKVNLQNSIYQQKKAGPGLSVECGMMINNRPNSTTGIQKMCDLKKAVKKADKISMMAEAVALGNIKEDMMGGEHCMD